VGLGETVCEGEGVPEELCEALREREAQPLAVGVPERVRPTEALRERVGLLVREGDALLLRERVLLTVADAQRLPKSDAVDEDVWLMHAEALGVSAPCDCVTDCVEV
jgi:hypothetical protein